MLNRQQKTRELIARAEKSIEDLQEYIKLAKLQLEVLDALDKKEISLNAKDGATHTTHPD